MDAGSAISLAGSVVGIVNVLAKSVNFLLNLQTKYKHADLTVSLLIGQLSTLKAALGQISEWITSSLVAVPQHEQLVSDITISIQGCKVLVSALDDRINSFDRDAAHTLNSLGKARLLWDENGTTNYLNHLSNQISALNLLLTALQCRSLFEQRDILQRDESRRIVKLVEDDMSSLLWLRDENSRHSRISISTENSKMLDAEFDFDPEIFNSKAYQVAMRSNMRKALSKKKETMAQRKRSPLSTLTNALDYVQLDDNENAQAVEKERLGHFSSKYHASLDDNEDTQKVGTVRSVPFSSEDHIQQDDNEDAQIVREEFLGPLPSIGEPIGELGPGAGVLVSRICDVMDHQAEDLANLAIRRLTPARKNRVFTKPRDLRVFPTSLNEQGVRVVSTRSMARRIFSFLPNGLNSRTSSAPAAPQRSREIDAQLRKDNEKRETKNVLILGTSRSGKSLLFDSMNFFADRYNGNYMNGFRELFKEVICSKMVWEMRTIIDHMEGTKHPAFLVDVQNEGHVQTIFEEHALENGRFGSGVALAIQHLWSDGGVQEYLSARHQRTRSDNYFFDALARIALPDYVPTNQDILRAWRIRTLGITCEKVRLVRHTCKIFDVGGARTQRKNWIHCFENVAVLIYLVDISDYDQVLYEDKSANRMQESLTVFDSICNTRWFSNTSIVLFFTKIDCLESKLASSPFKTYFPDFSGDPTDIEEVKDYIRMRFLVVNMNPEKTIDVYFFNLLSETIDAGDTALDIIEGILDLRERKERTR